MEHPGYFVNYSKNIKVKVASLDAYCLLEAGGKMKTSVTYSLTCSTEAVATVAAALIRPLLLINLLLIKSYLLNEVPLKLVAAFECANQAKQILEMIFFFPDE